MSDKTVTCTAGGYVEFDGFQVELRPGVEHPADSPIVKANPASFSGHDSRPKKKG